MQRAITWAVLVLLCLCAVGTTVALACSADSEGLELVDGELPGGG